jgi:hypothetical protein
MVVLVFSLNRHGFAQTGTDLKRPIGTSFRSKAN